MFRILGLDETPIILDEIKVILHLQFVIDEFFCNFVPMKRIVLLLIAGLLSFATHAQIVSELAYRRYTTQDGLPQMQTERLWQDARGYIYIGTLSGFVRYDGRTFTPFLQGRRENIVAFAKGKAFNFRRQWLIDGDEVTMLPIDPARKFLINNFNSADLPDGYVILEDDYEQHRMLCRVTHRGFKALLKGRLLDALRPDQRIYLDSLTGLRIPNGSISSYHRVGDTLYAFGHDGIYTVDGHTLRKRAQADWRASSFGLIARSTHDKQIVVADEHSIYLYDGQSVRQLVGGFNLIKDMMVDCWDRLWVATYQGLYCFFGQNFTNHRLTDRDDIVRAIGIGKSGVLTLGTLNGKVLTDGKLTYNDPQQFFLLSAVTVNGSVFMAGNGDVAEVSNGSVRWLGLPRDRYQFVAEGRGQLIVGSKETVLSYDPASKAVDTLSTDILHPWCAAEDGEGRLWIGSSSGLFCLSPTPGGQHSRAALEKVDYQQKLFITALDRTPQGHILFASNDSLFLVRHGKIESMNGQMPDLKGHEIRSLHVSTRGYLIVAVIDGLFVSRFGGDGVVSDTHFYNHENGFTLLEPLKATMAEEADGTVWLAGVEAMTSFLPEQLLAYSQTETYVAPPLRWYEHWWVLALGALLFALCVWLTTYAYLKRRHTREMLRLKREKKQKELQISSIRLKAIPHFHANVLAAIEYFVMNNSADEASRYLKLYSDFTNLTLLDIDKPARTVAEEVDYVTKYLELQKLRYGERLNYSIGVADNVDRKAMLPTMLLHTYVENAIKHGISPKPEGGHVSVIITNHGDDTVVTVEDDGIGRRKAKQLNKHATRMGLRILNEQIQLFNKTNKAKIHVHVSNIKNEEGKTAGTRFSMTIPKGYVYE